MSWWSILLILLDIYLMVALVSWMLLRVLEWVLCKDAKALPEQEQRLQQLDEAGIESSRDRCDTGSQLTHESVLNQPTANSLCLRVLDAP